MPKVLLIHLITESVYDDARDGYLESAIPSISVGWEDVSNETLIKLKESVYGLNLVQQYKNDGYKKEVGRYILLVQPEDQLEFIGQTIQEWLDYVEAQRAKRKKDEELAEKKAKEVKAKRAEKAKARELKKLEELKKKYGQTE